MRISDRGLIILRAFLDDPTKPMAGVDLFRRTGVGFSTIYPMLIRFEQAGWLNANWEDIDPVKAGRPAKRLYRLSALGQREARSRIDQVLQGGPLAWA